MTQLAPHQQRVIDEKDELSDRLNKLLAFLQTQTFDRLPEAERTRLRNQARHMDAYAATLEERIAAFTEQATSHDIDQMVARFLGWRLPADFSPDCGISFDGRQDDEWNKGKTWPVGTNLLSAEQARAMLKHVLGL